MKNKHMCKKLLLCVGVIVCIGVGCKKQESSNVGKITSDEISKGSEGTGSDEIMQEAEATKAADNEKESENKIGRASCRERV